jgi:protein-S-isoprenylcysteine O-methyltransferase Ste14
LAVWARVFLGANWSATVTIKQDHEIIRNGPYALVRHPIYSGFLLGMLGTAIAIGEVRGLIAWGLAFLGWWLKLQTEERFLLEQFGTQYLKYRKETKALIPFVL